MKSIISLKWALLASGSFTLAILLSGCASDSTSSSKSSAPAASTTGKPPEIVSAADVKLHEDKDIKGIWIAPGFNFHGYDSLYVEETIFKGEVRENETEVRTAAIGNLQSQLVQQLQTTGLFPKVTYGSPGAATGKNLRLVNTIVEFAKGGRGARYFAGLYGAGQPKLRVRGEMYDGDKPVFVYEAKRSGESAGAHMAGVFMSNTDIQTHDIYDLARDLAACVKRNAGN